ncbi:MAG TPA: FAD-dependent monooxygenase [Umezawaea sp.]|nr:FAD-dependent monooxygenase [Umezawaea sp.]
MKNTTVLISGAGIAGPSLALWLDRAGCRVTVVEKAPAPRSGGQAVDFKGATHLAVLERMGVLDEVRRRQTGGGDQTVIDADGRALTVIPGEFTGGELEIRRGDLAALLCERTPGCEYVHGDTITSLTETADGVHVTFDRGAPRTFDLVVGADGIHSNVRRLVFGPETDHVRFLGHHYALATTDVSVAKPVMYNEPGRMLAVGGPKADAFLVFASEPLDYDRYDPAQQKALLRNAFRDGGWRMSEVVDGLTDVYLDSISRVEVDRWSRGRVVLLGDSAFGNTLGGFGTGLAVVGAYVLAGELVAAAGDHRVAFARYEEKFRPYAGISRNGNAGPFLAPRTRLGIRARNLLFQSPVLLRSMLWMTDRFATRIELDDYPALTSL